MKLAICISGLLGLVWGTLATALLGGFSAGFTTKESIVWLLPGIPAGIAAGWITICSIEKKISRFRRGLLAYYTGICVYWLILFIILRIDAGIASTFDLEDNFSLLFVMLIWGTIPYGFILIPAAVGSCEVVSMIYGFNFIENNHNN